MRLAETAGICAVPIPSDFIATSRSVPRPIGKTLRMCISNHHALMKNSRAIHQLLAGLIDC